MLKNPLQESTKRERVLFSADAISQECAALLWDIAPKEPGDTIKTWTHKLAVATGLRPYYVQRVHYQQVPAIPAHVADQLRDLADRARAARARTLALKAENDALLDKVRRAGVLGCGTVQSGGELGLPPGGEGGGEDPRQLEFRFSGWRR